MGKVPISWITTIIFSGTWTFFCREVSQSSPSSDPLAQGGPWHTVKWKLQKKLKHLPESYGNYNFNPIICSIFSLLRLSASSFAESSSGREPKEGSSAPGSLFGGDVTEAHLQVLRDHALSMKLSLTPQHLCSEVLGLFCQVQGLSCLLLWLSQGQPQTTEGHGAKPHLPRRQRSISQRLSRRPCAPQHSPLTTASSFLATCDPTFFWHSSLAAGGERREGGPEEGGHGQPPKPACNTGMKQTHPGAGGTGRLVPAAAGLCYSPCRADARAGAAGCIFWRVTCALPGPGREAQSCQP